MASVKTKFIISYHLKSQAATPAAVVYVYTLLKTEGRPEIQKIVPPAGTTETTVLPSSCPTEETTYTADTTVQSCTCPSTTYCPTAESTITSPTTSGILQDTIRNLPYCTVSTQNQHCM